MRRMRINYATRHSTLSILHIQTHTNNRVDEIGTISIITIRNTTASSAPSPSPHILVYPKKCTRPELVGLITRIIARNTSATWCRRGPSYSYRLLCSKRSAPYTILCVLWRATHNTGLSEDMANNKSA